MTEYYSLMGLIDFFDLDSVLGYFIYRIVLSMQANCLNMHIA